MCCIKFSIFYCLKLSGYFHFAPLSERSLRLLVNGNSKFVTHTKYLSLQSVIRLNVWKNFSMHPLQNVPTLPVDVQATADTAPGFLP